MASKFILGIETSCDDTSVCILKSEQKKSKILSLLSFSQIQLLESWGGVVPEIAARNHLAKVTPLLKESFKQAQLSPKELDLIGVTAYPGLLGALLTGMNAAKTLSFLHQTPITPVNHLFAHMEAIHIDQKMSYPYLGILLSGGHSIFFLVTGPNLFKVLGSTIDDAAGEAFDKGGKLLGLGYPAGHIIDKLSKYTNKEDQDLFPIGLKSSADCRLSFSGLKTSLRVYLDKNPEVLQLKPSSYDSKEEAAQEYYNLCYSYQAAIINAIALKTKYALKKARETVNSTLPIVVGGGVACNSGLRLKLQKSFKNVHFVTPEFCTDNGAMIANFAARTPELSIDFPQCLELDAKSRFINKKEFN